MRIADEDILCTVQQRVAVGRGLGHGIARQIAAGAGLVLDYDRLAEARRQSLGVNPGDDVDRTAGRKSHDQPDRPVGIALRGRGDRQRGQETRDRERRLHHELLFRASQHEPYSTFRPIERISLPYFS